MSRSNWHSIRAHSGYDLPPPPAAVSFARIAPGHAFAWRGHVWTRATLDQALAATPGRRDHFRVVAAYVAAARRGHAATAFRWTPDPAKPGAACCAERVEADALVVPAAPPCAGPARPDAPAQTAPAWIATADRSPAPGRMVTVDTPDGPVAARLLLSDEAPGGAVWRTARGEDLDLDEVSLWRL